MSSPVLYELNTRCWLRALGEAKGAPVTLATVPDEEFARWRDWSITHIWLMGVWTTGPRARAQALAEPQLRKAYSELLPGWTEADVGGSPYAIADYHVPPDLGGDNGLKEFRRRLRAQGMKLLLDFVPNHLGLDHPWVRERPDLFVQSTAQAPDTFEQNTTTGIHWLAHGKDPYFPGWTDTVQLDYRSAATHAAVSVLLRSVAAQCDGVRCDMAMLVLNDVFTNTWSRFPPPARVGPVPEFWSSAISAVKHAHPHFLFLAEAYWGLESRLRGLGFDYTYDKALYDAVVGHAPGAAQRHLLGLSAPDLSAGAHFLENHDEPRIAALLPPQEHRAAALLILGLPGMRFLHEGQIGGARLKVPVQLVRRPRETPQPEVEGLYQKLLRTLPTTAVGTGRHDLLRPRSAWAGNPTWENFVLVQWQTQPPDFDLVVVNLAPHRSQCYAPLTVARLTDHNWSMTDLLGEERYRRAGDDLQQQGIYLDLPPYGAQVFHFEPAA